MQILIKNVIDLTSMVINAGQETCNFDSFNFILPSRDVTVTDSGGLLSPFGTDGILSTLRNGWKNQELIIYDDDGDLEYSGLIQDISETENGGEILVTIKTTNTLGALLQFCVEENDKTTYSNFQLDGDHGAGTTTLKIKTGTTSIPAISVLSFDVSLVPCYQIMTASGSPTDTITIDRGLELAATGDSALIVSVPRTDTPANLLKRALETALAYINQSERIDGDSFDVISDAQAADGFYLWVYVRKEDRITLGEYINRLMEIGDLFLTEDDGKIKLVNGMQWDGINPGRTLTESEIIEPVTKSKDYSRAIYAYNCLFINGDKIENKTKQIGEDDPALSDSNATRTWTPIQPEGENVIGHKFLYIDEATAEAAGDKRLLYNKYSRIQIKCALTYHFANGEKIKPRQFETFLLTMRASAETDFTNEPVRLLSYEINDEDLRFDNVVLELINYPTPGLTKPT